MFDCGALTELQPPRMQIDGTRRALRQLRRAIPFSNWQVKLANLREEEPPLA
jgi:hypothetical protein